MENGKMPTKNYKGKAFIRLIYKLLIIDIAIKIIKGSEL